jgi:bifunctional non-homologous end joining protein LigD
MPKTRLRARQTYLSGAMSASRELQRQLRRIEPCLPRPATKLPAGPGWIHEIKHDGYRIMAERDHGSVKLYSRNGYDFAERFPLAAAAIRKLPVRSCLIDGEADRLRCQRACGVRSAAALER